MVEKSHASSSQVRHPRRAGGLMSRAASKAVDPFYLTPGYSEFLFPLLASQWNAFALHELCRIRNWVKRIAGFLIQMQMAKPLASFEHSFL
jgi:hypothetical protein